MNIVTHKMCVGLLLYAALQFCLLICVFSGNMLTEWHCHLVASELMEHGLRLIIQSEIAIFAMMSF